MATENYENFLRGGYSSLNPEYGAYSHIQFRLPGEKFASTTSIQTANQVSEVASRIREGVRAVEIQQIKPEIFETMPRQQFEEIRALTKLTGVRTSLHAPIIDPSGFGEKGWGGETERRENENRLFNVISKASEINPHGNIPVVIHSSAGVPGTEWSPSKDKSHKPGTSERFVTEQVPVIDSETGQLVHMAKREERFDPQELGTTGKAELWTPEHTIDSLNNSEWRKQNVSFTNNITRAEELIDRSLSSLNQIQEAKKSKDHQLDENQLNHLDMLERENMRRIGEGELLLKEANLGFTNTFERAYKSSSEEMKQELKKLATEYSEDIKNIERSKKGVMSVPEYKQVLRNTVENFNNIIHSKELGGVPKIFKPVDEFAKEKASETFANLAARAYSELGGDKAPVLAIENMWQGMAFGRAKDMVGLIDLSRKKFEDRATLSKDKGGLGLSKDDAKKSAEKLIGMTWDVGHLNLAKKAGFTDEDIQKETEAASKQIKHLHFTDNFGYGDTHLAPGMGNVPFKKILEELEKSGALAKSSIVIEAGGITNPQMGLKMSPHKWTLSAFGSPIYGAKMAPYWNQVSDTPGNYFAFPLTYMPEKHFSMYGSGFSMLPSELGGQIPGTKSRFSGTENT